MLSKSNMIFTLVVVVALGGLAATYINVINGGGSVAMGFADPENAEMVALGKNVYGENCADCHGKNLEGQPNWRVRTADGPLPPPPHDVTGHTWHHPDQILLEITARGGQATAPAGFISGMPAFGEILSDDEILAVLAFIKTKWPMDVRKRQAQVSRRAAQQ